MRRTEQDTSASGVDYPFRHSLMTCPDSKMDQSSTQDIRDANKSQQQSQQQYQRKAPVIPAQQFQYLTNEDNEGQIPGAGAAFI